MAAAPGSQPLTDAARRKNPIMTVEVWRVGVDVSGKKLKEPDGLPARLAAVWAADLTGVGGGLSLSLRSQS